MDDRMTQRHQFHLRWSNYGQNLANSFIRLFESESLSDVTLFCEGESYRAHRVVLAASSTHFQELFEQCSTAQNLVVILDGTQAPNLRALLEFMYKGEVYIDDANLNTFLQTAKRLQVKGLSLSQNDLHNISNDVGEERGDGKIGANFTSPHNSGNNDMILAHALGPILIGNKQAPVPQQNPQNSHQNTQNLQNPPHQSPQNIQNIQNLQSGHHHGPLSTKNTNSSVHSPPNSFSSPSPSQTSPNHHPSNASTSVMYGDEKGGVRKKNRLPSPRHPNSPNGSHLGEGVEFSGLHHPSRPSPSLNPRLLELDERERQSMVPGSFASFSPHYGPSMAVPVPSGVPPPVPLQQHHSQQQTIVITENPTMRKMRGGTTENTMPEDLSIKLEVGRDDEMGGGGGKCRSYSMDLSPSDPHYSLLGPSGPSAHWPLPSPPPNPLGHSKSDPPPPPNSQQQQQHSADELFGNYKSKSSSNYAPPPKDKAPTTNNSLKLLGKKLKCPFCERLYGYETNLRAHIRQRHQGIRVPCPFCTRTFTRNNTVRRHVAREHRALLGGVGVRPFPHMTQGQNQADAGNFSSPSSSPRNSSGGSPSTSSLHNSGGQMLSGSGGGLPQLHLGSGGSMSISLSLSSPPPPPSTRPSSRSSSASGGGGTNKNMD